MNRRKLLQVGGLTATAVAAGAGTPPGVALAADAFTLPGWLPPIGTQSGPVCRFSYDYAAKYVTQAFAVTSVKAT